MYFSGRGSPFVCGELELLIQCLASLKGTQIAGLGKTTVELNGIDSTGQHGFFGPPPPALYQVPKWPHPRAGLFWHLKGTVGQQLFSMPYSWPGTF